jgi:hypothetical protein
MGPIGALDAPPATSMLLRCLTSNTVLLKPRYNAGRDAQGNTTAKRGSRRANVFPFVMRPSRVCLIFAAVVTCAAAFAPSDLPSLCWWPYVANGGRFGPPTVRLAQRLLGNALNVSVDVNGVFDSTTDTLIRKFQAKEGLSVDGALGPDTWPVLIGTATPADITSPPIVIEAVQDALTFNGFSTPVNGVYDSATVVSVIALQQARGAANTDGTVDSQVRMSVPAADFLAPR